MTVVFEDKRDFEGDQLITLRLPVSTLNAYKDLAISLGIELGEIIQNVLKQGEKTIKTANSILNQNK